MTRPLSVRDVASLLSASPHSRSAILVGGQALNIWAVSMGLAKEDAAYSSDIDFLGNRSDALAAGTDWQGVIHLASFDDFTPNAGVVVVKIDAEEHSIDFMSSLAGVDTPELRKMAVKVQGRGYEFLVMHPFHILQSQLENLYGSLHRRDDPSGEYYIGRLTLAVRVVHRAIADLLDQEHIRDALHFAERVGELAMSNPGVDAFARDAIDLLDALPAHRKWPKKFAETRLPQLRGYVRVKREKRARTHAEPAKDGGPSP